MADRLHVEQVAPAPAPESTTPRPIVVLHGFMGSVDDWRELAPEIARETGRDIWAVDLPGHGRSIHMPDDAYTFDGVVSAMIAALHEHALAPATLVGYSMGGRIAMSVACRLPDFVDTLVVESSHPGMIDPDERRTRRAHDDSAATRLVQEWPQFLEGWYDQAVFESLDARPDLRAEWIRQRASNNPSELARALRGFSTGRQDPLVERLHAANRPILFLAGDRDRKYMEIGQALADRVERVSFCSVEGAGHNVHAECPDAYLRALSNFL